MFDSHCSSLLTKLRWPHNDQYLTVKRATSFYEISFHTLFEVNASYRLIRTPISWVTSPSEGTGEEICLAAVIPLLEKNLRTHTHNPLLQRWATFS